jgi:hypothetical protein
MFIKQTNITGVQPYLDSSNHPYSSLNQAWLQSNSSNNESLSFSGAAAHDALLLVCDSAQSLGSSQGWIEDSLENAVVFHALNFQGASGYLRFTSSGARWKSLYQVVRANTTTWRSERVFDVTNYNL